MWTANYRHNWIWRDMFIEIDVKNMHIFQYQRLRRMSRQPRFAENTLENRNVDVIMFCHIRVIMSRDWEPWDWGGMLLSQPVSQGLDGKRCGPEATRSSVWSMCPTQLISTLLRGRNADLLHIGKSIPPIRDWYLHKAGEKHLSGYGGGGNWAHTSQMSLIFILAL